MDLKEHKEPMANILINDIHRTQRNMNSPH